jgi:hypothetical protein
MREGSKSEMIRGDGAIQGGARPIPLFEEILEVGFQLGTKVESGDDVEHARLLGAARAPYI